MVHWAACWLLLFSLVHGDIHIGGAINIFNYFGDLGAVLKVNPHYPRRFDYDSVDIFEDISETRSPSTLLSKDGFNGEFNLELCSSLAELYEVLFRAYYIEGMERPWRAFTGGWNNAATSRHLGINSSYLTSSHRYVLVRLIRERETVTMSSDFRLNNWTTDKMSHIVIGREQTALDFIQLSGSHYIRSYTTGDSLLQVFAFAPSIYDGMLQKKLQYEMSGDGIDQLLGFFTPEHAEYIGTILSSSKNTSLESWAKINLHSSDFLYANLLTLYSRPELLPFAEHLLGNNVLLSVELKSLAPFFTDNTQRRWFEEVLDNQIKMWELNI